MRASELTEVERRRILALHAEGMSRNGIARQVERSSYAVSKTVHDAGLTFARGAQVAAATEAKRMDSAGKRAALEAGLLDDALALREQLFRPARVWAIGGRDNTFTEQWLDRPDPADQLAIVRAVVTASDGAGRAAQIDRGANDAGGARSMLSALSAGLQAAYDDLGGTTQGTTDDK